ncbi:hypothetical protein KQX54_011281 [Cotesia glomerata]|uniref:Uncharacterized protein n=1 Tax=Cotesia glomerata TaxID=32391 RepID=A0AAV7I2U7_COTGL|nr:hypothetical protein KQX54_011281 [Cotesia glomerata]
MGTCALDKTWRRSGEDTVVCSCSRGYEVGDDIMKIAPVPLSLDAQGFVRVLRRLFCKLPSILPGPRCTKGVVAPCQIRSF